MKESNSYVLISPCRDEANHMRQTLDLVIAQSVRPARWIIVNDGSTDETPRILDEYKEKHDWIEVVTRDNRGRRSVGPGVIEAFYAGYAAINPDDYDFVCKLDLDLRLPPRYFEILIQRMAAEPRIATCSGKAYVEEGGGLVDERHGDDMSLGMIKFYRVSCFKAIGGFVREVMWDGIDCHRCRMHDWIACSWDEPELRFVHLRPMGSSQQSIYVGRMRHGYGQYFMGTGLMFMAASAVSRLNQKPYVLGSMAMLWGWLKRPYSASHVTPMTSSGVSCGGISGGRCWSESGVPSRSCSITAGSRSPQRRPHDHERFGADLGCLRACARGEGPNRRQPARPISCLGARRIWGPEAVHTRAAAKLAGETDGAAAGPARNRNMAVSVPGLGCAHEIDADLRALFDRRPHGPAARFSSRWAAAPVGSE